MKHVSFCKLCQTCQDEILDEGNFNLNHGKACKSGKVNQRKGPNGQREQWNILFAKVITLTQLSHLGASRSFTEFTSDDDSMSGHSPSFDSSRSSIDREPLSSSHGVFISSPRTLQPFLGTFDGGQDDFDTPLSGVSLAGNPFQDLFEMDGRATVDLWANSDMPWSSTMDTAAQSTTDYPWPEGSAALQASPYLLDVPFGPVLSGQTDPFAPFSQPFTGGYTMDSDLSKLIQALQFHALPLSEMTPDFVTLNGSSPLAEVAYCEYSDCKKKFTGQYARGNLARHTRQKHKGSDPCYCQAPGVDIKPSAIPQHTCIIQL
ncbi:hypothetical protein E8E12_001899 [Didymella heteroderae]|uniref:C2H2-type domain-containing protein n=1 Tax=Didymella heteroderae TaxID=1769908 RepID=A0A9P4WKZ7_9PLEO|nr:hypothetical protein E8E12_001899 [Didymella heteroderae]